MKGDPVKCGELYRLDFASGKFYVGVALGVGASGAARRYRNHRREACLKGSPLLVHKAWRKYGAPQLKVLAVLSNSELLPSEQRAIHAFRSLFPGGYNMTLGGETSPTQIPEIAARVGMKMRGNKYGLGRRHSLSTRQIMSRNRKGIRPQMPEGWREKISEALKGNQNLLGHTHSLETRMKMSVAGKGRPKSAEHRAALSAGMRGIPHIALRGVPLQWERRARISSALALHRAQQQGREFSLLPGVS